MVQTFCSCNAKTIPAGIQQQRIHNSTPQYDCGEGQEMADTYKACQPFLPLSSTVLFGRFAAAKCPHRTPQKNGVKLGGYPSANYCIRITNPYRSHPVSQRHSPVFFYTLYDIFENLIEFHHFYIKTSGFPTGKARKSGWLSCQFRPILRLH